MQYADLPESWVKKIFTKLGLVYGREFLSRWEGQEINAVMGDWARELAGFHDKPKAIAYALKFLPEKPPTVLQFRALCNASPSDDGPLKLSGPLVEPSPEIMARVGGIAKNDSSSHPLAWAHALLAKQKGGIRLSAAQRDALAQVRDRIQPLEVA